MNLFFKLHSKQIVRGKKKALLEKHNNSVYVLKKGADKPLIVRHET